MCRGGARRGADGGPGRHRLSHCAVRYRDRQRHDRRAEGARLFQGYRGAKPADAEALAELLVNVSRMAIALESRLHELDINPLFVRPAGEGVVAADALVVLR